MKTIDQLIDLLIERANMPANHDMRRVWLRVHRNFVATRKVAMKLYGVGPKTWTSFLKLHNLREEMTVFEIENQQSPFRRERVKSSHLRKQ